MSSPPAKAAKKYFVAPHDQWRFLLTWTTGDSSAFPQWVPWAVLFTLIRRYHDLVNSEAFAGYSDDLQAIELTRVLVAAARPAHERRLPRPGLRRLRDQPLRGTMDAAVSAPRGGSHRLNRMGPEPARPVRPLAKQIAHIKAVAGIGVAVEDRIAAVGAAAILLGRSPFPTLTGRLVRLAFRCGLRGKRDGHFGGASGMISPMTSHLVSPK